MIVQLKGKVKFPITLDPSVWIFDDRKVEFDQAFLPKAEASKNPDEENEEASKRWDRAIYQQKINPPVNKSISKFERNKILESTFVMPIKPFLKNAEVNEDANAAYLITNNGETEISINDLENGYFLFAVDGKPIKENGPLHFYFGDGSNKDTPITGVNEILFR
jgi:hypothetical protein